MTGWLLLAVMTAVLLALGRFWWRLTGPELTLFAAALALGGAGYALSGRPDLAGRPVAERPPLPLPPPLADVAERDAIFGTFTRATTWLRMSDRFLARGSSEDAVALLRNAIRENPHDAILWVALGDALARHGRGVNAASTLAFERAVETAPAHPGPHYYLGLIRFASRQPERALESWRAALARTTPRTVWRPALEARIAAVEAGLISRARSSPAAHRS